MPVPVLYCADPLNPRRVDGHFAPEAREVRERGGIVALIDHDALLRGDAARAVERVPRNLGPTWYRGWMIPSPRYAELAAALDQRDASLKISPKQYQTAHELPGWYPLFADVTPATAWSTGVPDAHELTNLASTLRPGPGIVKDYVKSRKHEWAEACYIPDLTDAPAVARIVRRFTELQAEFLTGGIVLREFEPFVTPQSAAAEVRIWWLDAKPRLLTPHPDSPHTQLPTPDFGKVEAAVQSLGCRFAITDMALRDDGVWRVIEVGDGQVSDPHPAINPGALANLLLEA
jgi:hypothetical protein